MLLRDATNLSDEQIIERADDRRDAAEILLARYEPYLISLIKNFPALLKSRTCFDDLLQAARLGLVKAVYKFDSTRGAKFQTFMTHVVTKEIIRELERQMPFKLPRKAFDNDEVLNEYVEICSNLVSLDDYIENSEGDEFESDIPDDRAIEEIDRTMKRWILSHALNCLKPQERTILHLRYNKQWEWDEISHALQIPIPALWTKHRNALRKLRRVLERWNLL